jgi:hypothetical protein
MAYVKPPWLYEHWPVGLVFIILSLFLPMPLKPAFLVFGVGTTTYLYLKLKEWEKIGGKEEESSHPP